MKDLVWFYLVLTFQTFSLTQYCNSLNLQLGVMDHKYLLIVLDISLFIISAAGVCKSVYRVLWLHGCFLCFMGFPSFMVSLVLWGSWFHGFTGFMNVVVSLVSRVSWFHWFHWFCGCLGSTGSVKFIFCHNSQNNNNHTF